jgi:hypothetical protein
MHCLKVAASQKFAKFAGEAETEPNQVNRAAEKSDLLVQFAFKP